MLLHKVVSAFLMILFFSSSAHSAKSSIPLEEQIRQMEKSFDGQVGVAVLDAEGRQLFSYRGNTRFPYCSTFKVLLAAAMLNHSESEPAFLEKIIRYSNPDLVNWSPVTEKHIQEGMNIFSLCSAALQYSDNTAANLLLRELGGPKGLTDYARSLGDTVFFAERWEPWLNSATPGDSRDTTSPLAMAETLRKITLGNVLKPQQRKQLCTWMIGNTTGKESIRAGIPLGWTVGDKTGSGTAYGTTNDIAVIWTASGAPYILTIYLRNNTKDAPSRKAVLAAITALVVKDVLLRP